MGVSIWKQALLWSWVMALAPMASAATLPLGWQLLPPTSQEIEAGLPAALQLPLLSRDDKAQPQVQIVVSLPFDQVLPVVQQALAPLGTFNGALQRGRVAYIDADWGNVLLSHRPALKAELVQRANLATLQQMVAKGSLLPQEIPSRLARYERDFRFSSSQDIVAELQGEYSVWAASAESSQGLVGRLLSTVNVRVTQLDAVLGEPATAIFLSRTDDWPNPDGGVVGQMRALADFNIFSRGPSARLSRVRVPAALFTPVFDALSQLPGANVRLGCCAGEWMAEPGKSSQPSNIVEPKYQVADGVQRINGVKRLGIGERPLASPQRSFVVSDFLPLADGSWLLLEQNPRALHRWGAGEADTPQLLWTQPQGESSSRELLSANPEGSLAYLAMQNSLVQYDAASAQLVVHPLSFAKPRMFVGDSYLRYLSGEEGVPLVYNAFDRAGSSSAFSLWAPAEPTAADDAPWHYSRRFVSQRPDAVKHGFPGNLVLKPVTWDGPQPNLWVEDAAGLTELDGKDGRVLRVIALPRRFGRPDPLDDTGMAQWVPPPFGSVKGNWIAVGFVLMEGEKRIPGMHVVDVESGKVSRSLALPGLDSLVAAAASPDGRMLALGSNRRGQAEAAIWNLGNGQSTTLVTEREACDELRQLRWSLDGNWLWGRCSNALVQWPLSPAWRGAKPGGLP